METADLSTVEVLSLLLLLVVSLVVITVIVQLSLSKKRKTAELSYPKFSDESSLPQRKSSADTFPKPVEEETEIELRREEEFEVTVIDETTNKIVTLTVNPHHTVGSLLDTLIEGLELPKEKTYTLVFDGKPLDEISYNMTLQSCGIKQGEKLILTH